MTHSETVGWLCVCVRACKDCMCGGIVCVCVYISASITIVLAFTHQTYQTHLPFLKSSSSREDAVCTARGEGREKGGRREGEEREKGGRREREGRKKGEGREKGGRREREGRKKGGRREGERREKGG